MARKSMIKRRIKSQRSIKSKKSIKRKSMSGGNKGTYHGYCLKCKKKGMEMKNTSKPKKLKNGSLMIKGNCLKCNCGMATIQKA